jgi:pimeloyl-ACP methyl ester carboxylesterase
MLLHGWSGSPAAFSGLVERWGRDADVRAPLLPALDPRAQPRQPWSVAQLAAGLASDIRAQGGGPVRLVAHSFSARPAIELCNAHPELVDSLVLVSAGGMPVPTGAWRRRAWRALFVGAGLPGLGPLARALHRRLALRAGWSPMAPRHALSYLRALDRDMRPQLRALRLPALVVWGQHDEVLPVALGRRMAALIPGATLEVLPAGHHPHTECESEFAAAVESFWNAAGRSGTRSVRQR